MALHKANRHDTGDGPTITVSPARATLTDSRPSCRDAVLDAIDRLQQRTGATEFARRDIVAEMRATNAGLSGRPSTGVYAALPATNLAARITTFVTSAMTVCRSGDDAPTTGSRPSVVSPFRQSSFAGVVRSRLVLLGLVRLQVVAQGVEPDFPQALEGVESTQRAIRSNGSARRW
jgi:hypothetical protein